MNTLQPEHINELMTALAGMFPAWKQAVSTKLEADAVRQQWYTALTENNITPDELRAGLERARRESTPWLPSCGQFLSWCRPVKSLTVNQAWQKASQQVVSQEWDNPQVFEAAQRTGEYEIKRNPTVQCQKLFADHYKDVLEETRLGSRFRLPEPKQENYALLPQSQPADPEVGSAAIKALRETLGDKINVDS